MDGFEVFTGRIGRGRQRRHEPSVTITARGVLSINPAAYAELGSPESVELLFDPEKQIVGVRASTSLNAYKVQIMKRATTGEPYAFSVSIVAFARHFGIDHTVAHLYTPTIAEGFLRLDLAGGTPVTSNRAKKSLTSSRRD